MTRRIDIDAERVFENRKVAGENPRLQQSKFYWATALGSQAFHAATFERMKGKHVLEIGCSDGEMTAKYASHCRSIVGADISDSGITKARQRNIPNAEFQVCDAHAMPFEDGTFDVVVANGVLHHLDLKTAVKEIRRVLKKGGVLCAHEPLGINPLFSLYRFITPESRTVDERPFTVSDMRLMTSTFSKNEVMYGGFFSIFAAFYRKEFARRWLSALDSLLARTPLRHFFWQFYGFYSK